MTPLGAGYGIPKQHGYRGRSHATQTRCDSTGHLTHFLVYVGQSFLPFQETPPLTTIAVGLCRVILGVLVVGGRRLRHLSFLKGGPLLQRFCGLKDLPTDCSVSRWLKRFTAPAEEALKRLYVDVVARLVGRLQADASP